MAMMRLYKETDLTTFLNKHLEKQLSLACMLVLFLRNDIDLLLLLLLLFHHYHYHYHYHNMKREDLFGIKLRQP